MGRPGNTALLLVGIALLTPSTARADTLEVPTEFMAQPDGSFSFDVTFHKGPGSDRLAGYGWGGFENINGGLSADCFCASFCRIFNPGDTFTFHVAGQLTNPGLQGLLSASVALCASPGANAIAVIRPYSTTGLPPVLGGDARFWNAPNPFSTLTTFHYRLSEAGQVTLSVHDLAGRLVARVVDDVLPAGPREATWDLRAHPGVRQAGGVLFARLTTPGGVRTLPLILAR